MRTNCCLPSLALATLAILTGGPLRQTCGAEARPAALFPFVLPWDDATPGATDVSSWLSRPAGSKGYVTVGADGHFQVGGRRIRFLGVNLSFAGGMPEKSDADKIAARLAKFGVNVVRFHHMDTSAWPNGLRAAGEKSTGRLSAEALDRLDYFIAQLKARGIYANLNLLVGRPFNAADGLPAEIEQLDWKDRHVIGFFDPVQLKLQQDYARALLTHTNAYTGLAYTDEPAVAFVEINNEQGLVHAWLGGKVDLLPAVFQQVLRRQWNEWLQARYPAEERLRTAWAEGAQPWGDELLRNGGFTGGLEHWTVEQHAGAQAEVAPDVDLPAEVRATAPSNRSLRVRVIRPGQEAWHVQLHQGGLKLRQQQAYTLSFWARADAPRRLSVSASQASEPWRNLGLAADVPVTSDWKRFDFVFNAGQEESRARIAFSRLGGAGATLWLADVSLRAGGVEGLRGDERLTGQGLPCFQKADIGRRSPAAQRDWMRFLFETEDRYWQAMYRFLKQDLKVHALVAGTIVGCSTPNLMAKLDWVDTHAYWQHPRFPGRPWDAEDWIVENRTMVNEPGGTLPGLALKRVVGKPHACTEYNHTAPNTYSSEGFLLLAAYAALQDWDAIYVYSYAHTRSQGWDSRRINGFFDIDQHPTKMATLPAAAAMFVRGDVRPAEQGVVASLTSAQEVDLLRTARAWALVDAGSAGLPRQAALVHRVATATDGAEVPKAALSPESFRLSGEKLDADTGELSWDLRQAGRGVVTVNVPRSKAVIGYGGGRRFELGRFVIEPGRGLQDGWCTLTLTALDGATGESQRWLLTATGYAENTDMGWKNAEKSSVGRAWGRAPSLVEGVEARISLAGGGRLECWALDERGQRREQLPVSDGSASLGPRWQTLWYELIVR